ncbi:MAG: Nucleotide-diphospho-sugar transferase [Verrucomicrobia bacterium]|jgi:hypothetical protein|nr:Nucleotide-diphospho-sugar transferase [Verrucomicrobiota bacterium]
MNVPYHLALHLGRLRRRHYKARLARIVSLELPARPELPVHFYGFSSHNDLPEQIACLRSLHAHVGLPRKTTIISDGSHTAEDLAILDRFVVPPKVIHFSQFISPNLPPAVMRYAAQHPLGKKLAAILSLPVDEPSLYSDSDILYFAGAEDLRRQLAAQDSAAAYLPDCYPSFDARLLVSPEENLNPVNAGFFFLNRPLDWRSALERFNALTGDGSHFTEQTVIHLALRAAKARPLPAEKYVLANDDQWLWRDLYAGPQVALRHYISSFRHKFWMKVRY